MEGHLSVSLLSSIAHIACLDCFFIYSSFDGASIMHHFSGLTDVR